MLTVSTTQIPPLKFNVKNETCQAKMRMQSGKIGWIHSIADKAGAKFDVVIKDGFGRVRKLIENFGVETEKSGQLLNMETMVGEELTFEVENIKNANDLTLFVN